MIFPQAQHHTDFCFHDPFGEISTVAMPGATISTPKKSTNTNKGNESTTLSFLTSSPGTKCKCPYEIILQKTICSCPGATPMRMEAPGGGCQFSGPRWMPRSQAQMAMSCVHPGAGTGPGRGGGPAGARPGSAPTMLPGSLCLGKRLCPPHSVPELQPCLQKGDSCLQIIL